MSPTAENRMILREGFSVGDRTQGVGPFPEPSRSCPACGSALQPFRLIPHQLNQHCGLCGLMETPPVHEPAHAARITHHFRAVDPHGAVAASKEGFYAQALGYLNARTRCKPRTLLDVGCGFGYFLERAAGDGWHTIGIDIVAEAVSAARERVPTGCLFAADLRGAGLAAGSVDAITMWDMLDMVPDPGAELAESLRVLAPGGIIGIRVRNLTGGRLLLGPSLLVWARKPPTGS